MKSVIFIISFLVSSNLHAQSDLHTILKGSELILTGLTVLKVARSDAMQDTKIIDKLCIKNKLNETIIWRISGKDLAGADLIKEIIIPKEGKECLYALPKGIYTYEIELANKEIYKKGEYKFDKETTITIKEL